MRGSLRFVPTWAGDFDGRGHRDYGADAEEEMMPKSSPVPLFGTAYLSIS